MTWKMARQTKQWSACWPVAQDTGVNAMPDTRPCVHLRPLPKRYAMPFLPWNRLAYGACSLAITRVSPYSAANFAMPLVDAVG